MRLEIEEAKMNSMHGCLVKLKSPWQRLSDRPAARPQSVPVDGSTWQLRCPALIDRQLPAATRPARVQRPAVLQSSWVQLPHPRSRYRCSLQATGLGPNPKAIFAIYGP
ncbi:hypothetical protein GUJ93_ZPchr0013g36994 [Zizania palustris]|uniref:Uncharacterized protein n=1 Tax=Zizania palustris TaxID=103762 RepID=A0A8J5WUN5_ZIZPA|nr:hypothetical protein GUJ93_ZPchr0013g36994 [Zizania palustris]